MRLNVEAWYWEYEDVQQVQFGFVNPEPNFALRTYNAAKQESYGVEAEAIVQVGEAGAFRADVTWLQSEWAEFALPGFVFGPFNIPPNDLSGADTPFAPEWSANLAYSHVIDLPGGGALIPAVRSRLRTAQTLNTTGLPGTRVDGNTSTDASLTYEAAELGFLVQAYVNNIEGAYAFTFAGATPAGLWGSPGTPRTYGVRVRKQFAEWAGATFLAGGCGERREEGREGRPNIVFILADDLGYADLSVYGRRDYETPAIDGLAADGVRFTQAHANSAVCSATRTALMTGRYQNRLPIGLEEPLTNRDVGLPPAHPTLPSLLRAAGYATALIGKWHLGALPEYGPLLSGYEHFWGFRGGGGGLLPRRPDGPAGPVGRAGADRGDRLPHRPARRARDRLRGGSSTGRPPLLPQPALQRAALAVGGAG